MVCSTDLSACNSSAFTSAGAAGFAASAAGFSPMPSRGRCAAADRLNRTGKLIRNSAQENRLKVIANTVPCNPIIHPCEPLPRTPPPPPLPLFPPPSTQPDEPHRPVPWLYFFSAQPASSVWPAVPKPPLKPLPS